jgi:hypothetical protein
MTVWRDGVTGALAGNAVDMTLHVVNADNNSNRRLAWRDRTGRSQPPIQSRTMVQWSRRRVHFIITSGK